MHRIIRTAMLGGVALFALIAPSMAADTSTTKPDAATAPAAEAPKDGADGKPAPAANEKPAAPATHAVGWVVEVGKPGSKDASRPVEDVYLRFPNAAVSQLDMNDAIKRMPVPAFYLPQIQMTGLFKASVPGPYKFAIEVTSSKDQVLNLQCWPRIEAMDAGTWALITIPPQSVPSKPGSKTATMLMKDPVEFADVGLQEMRVSITCNPGEGERLADEPQKVAGFFNPANANDKKAKATLLPKVVIKVQRPGESGFSELKDDEVVFEIAKNPNLSTNGSSSGTIKLGARKDVLELMPHLKDKLADTQSGWYVEARDIEADIEDAPLVTFPAEGAKWTLGDHIIQGAAQWSVGYVSRTRLVAPKTGDYVIALVASNGAVYRNKKVINDKCSASIAMTDANDKDIIISKPEDHRLYSAGMPYESDAWPNGITAPVWSGTVKIPTPGIYALKTYTRCERAEYKYHVTDPNNPDFADQQVSWQVLIRTPDDNALRLPGKNDFRYRPGK